MERLELLVIRLFTVCGKISLLLTREAVGLPCGIVPVAVSCSSRWSNFRLQLSLSCSVGWRNKILPLADSHSLTDFWCPWEKVFLLGSVSVVRRWFSSCCLALCLLVLISCFLFVSRVYNSENVPLPSRGGVYIGQCNFGRRTWTG